MADCPVSVQVRRLLLRNDGGAVQMKDTQADLWFSRRVSYTVPKGGAPLL